MKSQRKSRVTRQSSENRQSCSSSGRSRRSLSANEQTSGRKRKMNPSEDTSSSINNKVNEPMPKIQKKVIGNKKFDAFCWICHKVADEFYCPNCPRIYHQECYKKSKSECACNWTSIDGNTHISQPSDFKELLLEALYNVTEDTKDKKNLSFQKKNQDKAKFLQLFKTWPDMPENELLFDAVDIETVVDRIHHETYKSIGQFYQDVKWIYHNWCIIKGPGNEISAMAQKFLKAVKQQLIDLEACGECYHEKCSKYPEIDFFTKVCANPHPIVWAKLKGFKFWPAKCLRVVNGHADVRFFGTHDKSLISLAQVYKISKDNPSGNPKKPRNSTRMTSYEEAMAELSMYILNYENQFGSFHYSSDKTPLDPETIAGKKGHQIKNRNRLDVSMDSEVNENDAENSHNVSGYSELNTQQTSPHLNVSILNDDPAETKVFRSSSVIVKNLTEKANEDLVGNVTEQMPSVVVMTFSADEECAGEMSTSAEDNETAQSHSHLPKISSQLSATAIKGSEMCDNVSTAEALLNNPETAETNSDSFTNTNACENFPVISSNSSPFVITSTQSLRNNTSDSIGEISRTISGSQTPNEQVGKALDAFSEILHQNEDEVQIVTENRYQKSLVQSITENPPLMKTLSELLFCNKPNLRNYLSQFQNMVMRLYITMWLEANHTRLNENECKTFHTCYEKMCKSVEIYKAKIRCLEKEKAILNEKLKVHVANHERQKALKDTIIQAHRNSSHVSANMLKKIIKEKSHNLAVAKKSIDMLQTTKRSLLSEKEEVELLLQQSQKELAESKKTIEDLQSKLQSNQKVMASVQCQTDPFGNACEEIISNRNKLNISDPSCNNSNLSTGNSVHMNSSVTQQTGYVEQETELIFYQPTVSFPGNMFPSNNVMQPDLFTAPLIAPQPSPMMPLPIIGAPPSMIQNSSSFSMKSNSRSQSLKSRLSTTKFSKTTSKYSSNRSYSKSNIEIKAVKKACMKNSIKRRK